MLVLISRTDQSYVVYIIKLVKIVQNILQCNMNELLKIWSSTEPLTQIKRNRDLQTNLSSSEGKYDMELSSNKANSFGSTLFKEYELKQFKRTKHTNLVYIYEQV